MICPSCGTENPDRAKFCMECTAPLGSSQALAEERKVVTILFCDLVMFTARAETLDPEDVRAFLVPYYDVLTEEIARHGGVVDKFLGDGVMAVFGAPLAHEDDPERAVRTALKILERIPALGLDLHARVGITTGEVMVVPDPAGRGDAITGDAANTASRLQGLAPVDGVVVGEATYRATSHLFDYEVLEPAQVKGKAEPVPIYRPLAPIARPSSELIPDTTPFVGRDFELESLIRLFDRSRTGPSTEFVTVVADPGIGKSRLVRELARHVESLPELVTWRQGRCLPYGDGISFWALGEIIKAHAGIYDTDDQATLASKLDAVLVEPDESLRAWMRSRIAPLVGLETTTQPPQQEEAFTAWRRFLEQIAERGPTVLVVEDLHRADDALVQFLQHLAERTSGLPILVVVTARPEVEERHPTWLGRARRSTVLPLTALPDKDMTTLVEATLEGASPELISTVLERAGGSPLYAEQLAAMLRDQQLPIAGGSLDESAIPPSIQALLAARIDALTPELKATLLDASVVGKTFWSGALAAPGDHPDLEDHLAELARRDFIRPAFPSSMEGELEFSFVHALVRDVAHGELPRAARMTRHRATAAWIIERAGEALGEDAEIVVAHLERALELAEATGATEETVAIENDLVAALVEAADAALRTNTALAKIRLQRLLSLLDERDPRRPPTLAKLGGVLSAIGETSDAIVTFDAAADLYRSVGDVEGIAGFVTPYADAMEFVGDVARGRALVEGLIEEFGDRASPGRAMVLAYEAQHLAVGDDPAAGAVAAQALSVADRLGIPPPPRALEAAGLDRLARGDLDGEGDVRRAIERYLDDGDPNGAVTAQYNLGFGLGGARGFRAFHSAADEAAAMAAERGVALPILCWRLIPLMNLGEWDEVLTGWHAALRVARSYEDVMSQAVLTRLVVELSVDRGDEVVLALGEVDLVPSFARFPGEELELGACMLALRLAYGEGVGDLGLFERISRAGETLLFVPAFAVRTLVRAGAVDLAADLLAICRPHSVFARTGLLQGQASVAEARGDLKPARAWYEEAGATWSRLEAVWDAAHSLAGLGRCLVALGETEEGVARLNEARELWVGMKATPRIAEIDELLATVG